MYIYTGIISENQKWELASNYDLEKKRYYMTYLKNPIDEADWDSREFIFDELAPMVLAMHNLKDVGDIKEDYLLEIYEWLRANREEIAELNEILQQGVTMGWGKLK